METTWSTADTRFNGVISKRLSNFSFETHDPVLCAEWLRALEYVDVPRGGPGEHARLMIGISTAIVYSSGIVICLPGVRA